MQKISSNGMLQPLCMPALIFLLFSVTHVIIDMYKENYDKAVLEFFIAAIFTLLLNLLCRQGLGIVSWIIVSIPFLLMTTIAGILLFSFKVNPATGQPLPPPPPPPTHPAGNVYPIQVQYTEVPPGPGGKQPTASLTTAPPPVYPAPVN
jgi:hypothetical protein